MRSTTFIVDGNEYLSQRSAIGTIAIDEVNRNPGYVLVCRNGLVECDRILGVNSLQWHFTLFQTSLVVEVSLELPGKKNAKAAGEVELAGGSPSYQWLAY